MAGSNKPQPNEISILSLWYSMRNSIKILLALALLAGIITYIVLSLMQPRYSSESRLTISPKPTDVFAAEYDGAPLHLDNTTIKKQITILQSNTLLKKVAKNLKLNEREEFGEGQDSQLLSAIRKRLKVSDVGGSDIAIRFSSVDKKLAAQFVNELAQSYEHYINNLPLQKTQLALEQSRLEREIKRLTEKLQVAEPRLKRLRAEMETQSAPAYEQRRSALNTELKRAENKRAAARTKWQLAKKLIEDKLEALPEIQNSPLIQSLIAQKALAAGQLVEAQTLLPPDHPQIHQIASDLNKAKTALQAKAGKVLQGLKNVFLAADDRVKNIRREISTLNFQGSQTSNEEKLKSLEADVLSQKDALKRLKKKLEDNKKFFDGSAVPIAIGKVYMGTPGSEPDFFQMLPYILLVSIAVFVLGLTFATAREIIVFDNPPNNPNVRVQTATSPISAEVREPNHKAPMDNPVETQQNKKIATPAVSQTESITYIDPNQTSRQTDLSDLSTWNDTRDGLIQNIAARILNNGQNVTCYRTMIVGEDETIEVAREGIMLAHALAQSDKRVGFVDWHMSGESIAERLGFDVKSGILDLLQGNTTSFQDIIADVPNSSIRYIAAGDKLELEYEDLDVDGLNALFKAFDEFYDHLVVIGRFEVMQALFEASKGYFHAGIVVTDYMEKSADIEYGSDIFLEFEVADIDLMRIGSR